MWRPKNWIKEISFEEISKIKPCLVSMMTIKEKKIYEAGADAMLKELLIYISKETKRLDGTTYLVPDYEKYREVLNNARM